MKITSSYALFWPRSVLCLLAGVAWFCGLAQLGLIEQLMTNPTAAFSYFGIFVLYFFSDPPYEETFLVVFFAAVIRFAFRRYAPPVNDFPFAPVVYFAGLLGYVGVGSLILRCGVAKVLDTALIMLKRVIIFAVLGIVIGLILAVASSIRPVKFDLFLYSLERAFGLPSFVVGRWFAASPALVSVESLIYYSLPFALAVTYAAHLKHPQRGTDFLLALYLNGLVGFGLYILYPACGPAYVFQGDFPSFPPVILDSGISPLVLNCAPNAMPSLHVAGALLILWNAQALGNWRWAASVYLLLTVIGTLGFGEHYFIDLIVAMPYALVIQSLATESRYQIPMALLGASGVLLWIALFRYATPALARVPQVLWMIAMATALVTIFGRRLLNSQSLRFALTGRLNAEPAN